ncbi:MAG TPA: M48 family metalloprotease [Solirubrobacteraceae bacterium]|nr:M48 family metalloprotease [Solirubrobacteraceae bacterium]
MAKRTGLSTLELNLILGGLVLLAAALVAALAAEDAGGARRLVACAGLVSLLLSAGAYALRIRRAGEPAALPVSVGRTRIAPARGFAAATVAVAVVLPLAAAATGLVLYDRAWLPVAAVLVLGGAHAIANGPRRPAVDEYRWPRDHELANELLQRLCMRAGMRAPELVVEPAAVANAWTSRGRIHVSLPLIELLDRNELEAVIAHEVAHLARRDVAVMEICSAPSRVLLGYSSAIIRVPKGLLFSQLLGLWILALLCVPCAFALAWLSRLLVLGSSRSRECAADTAASALTGRPSALASALLKLEAERDWAPRDDLREVSVLCIVGTGRRLLGGLLESHPPTAARVRRLEAIESRL